jgi:hypothetical protein
VPAVDPQAFRKLALALPEAEEHPHWERPSFRVRGKIFATLRSEERRAILKLPRLEQQALVASKPETFGLVGWEHQGWTGVDLNTVDPDELAELIEEAWRGVAPKRLVAARDEAS